MSNGMRGSRSRIARVREAISDPASTNSRPNKIGIVGYYGCGNLGDDTVVAILIKRIKESYPGAEIVGFSLNPADTERRHGIKAFHIRGKDEARFPGRPAAPSTSDVKPFVSSRLKEVLRKWPALFNPVRRLKNRLGRLSSAIVRELSFLWRSFRQLRGFDLLIVPGSGPLTEWWGGAWAHPYSLLSWALLARMTGTKVIVVSIGYASLKTRLGKSFCKWFLWMAHYRSFRDRCSRDTMEAFGLKGSNPVYPDQGFGLLDLIGANSTLGTKTRCERPDAGLVVGVNPVAECYCVQPNADGACMRDT